MPIRLTLDHPIRRFHIADPGFPSREGVPQPVVFEGEWARPFGGEGDPFPVELPCKEPNQQPAETAKNDGHSYAARRSPPRSITSLGVW